MGMKGHAQEATLPTGADQRHNVQERGGEEVPVVQNPDTSGLFDKEQAGIASMGNENGSGETCRNWS
jgi:hypothetical protein